jgi:hypothetical protein
MLVGATLREQFKTWKVRLTTTQMRSRPSIPLNPPASKCVFAFAGLRARPCVDVGVGVGGRSAGNIRIWIRIRHWPLGLFCVSGTRWSRTRTGLGSKQLFGVVYLASVPLRTSHHDCTAHLSRTYGGVSSLGDHYCLILALCGSYAVKRCCLFDTRPRFAGLDSLLLPEPSARIGMAHGSLRFTVLF